MALGFIGREERGNGAGDEDGSLLDLDWEGG